MPSCYVAPVEYEALNMPAGTTPADVRAASTTIDSFLDRPEGLVWVPDVDGNPTYMLALEPTRTIALQSDIAPGTNVNVDLRANTEMNEIIGEIVVIDRGTAAMEACRVKAVAGTAIVLAKVLRNHSAGAKVEFGLTIRERRNLPAKRAVVRVSRSPMARLMSGTGRYGYGRRTDQIAGQVFEPNLISTIQAFGGPPAWVPWEPSSGDVNLDAGEVWVPAGMMLAYFSEVRMWYCAGWPGSADQNERTTVPYPVKRAVASLLSAAAAFPEMSGNIKSLKAGDTAVTRFRDSVLDADTKRTLQAYKARTFY